jgi:hypothetical protein
MDGVSQGDPRKAKTLDKACSNGDGTFNGNRALAWLSEAVHPGHGVSEEEVRAIWNKVKEAKNGR